MPATGKQPFWPLMRVVGKGPFYAFGLLTFLVVAILAATNVVSKYALKVYTEGQINRINWDAIVYQTSDIPEIARMKRELGRMDGVSSVLETGSIKLSLGSYMHANIGQGKTNIPWFMMIYSERPDLLPPAIRPLHGGSVTALVGPQAMISPYLSSISVGNDIHIVAENPPGSAKQTELFRSDIRQLATPERLEIVKFFLDKFGSAAFIPDGALIFSLPKEAFESEVPRIAMQVHEISKPQLALAGEGGSEEEPSRTSPQPETVAAKLMPEFMHLISIDRKRVFTGWDLDRSYQRVEALDSRITKTSSRISFDSFVNSELLVTLKRMAEVSKLIGVLAVLISFPILWLSWLFAGSLSNLIILNQRRLIGLLRLRGASYGPIRASLLVAIGAGGILGGISGALAGTLLPYLLFRASGVDVPWNLLFTTIQEPKVLFLFIVAGTLFGLLAGRKVTNHMAQVTPLEASRRVSSVDEGQSYHFTRWQLLCLLFGSSKILCWIFGIAPHSAVLKNIDNLLNFAGAALFLYGFAALIVSRRERLQSILKLIVNPLARDLNWFAVSNMLTRPNRVMATILVAALTFGVVVYSQITSKSFYEKTMRALKLNLGSEVTIEFNAVDLTGGELSLQPVGRYISDVRGKLDEIQSQIKRLDPAIQNVGFLYEFSIPGNFYTPGKNYLQLYLIEKPDQFLEKTYYESNLGVDRPFRAVLQNLGRDDVLVSKGFAANFDQSDFSTLGLGSGKDGDVSAKVAGAVYLLPGLSQFMIQDRESFSSASVEFINSIIQSQPYVVGRADSTRMGSLSGLLSRVVVHIQGGGDENRLVAQLVKAQARGLLPPAAAVNSKSQESSRLSSDMFIYLALENIKVFMIGGVLVALAGLIAIAIVNFIEGKRLFALLRLRGSSPAQLMRVVMSDLVAPLTVGACIGVPVGLVTGYGLTNAIFALPGAASILQILPVHLTLSWLVAGFVISVLGFFFLWALSLSSWIFRKTAREALGH